MGIGHLDITCIVSVHYTIPLQCWENGVSWWQSLELQEQCHLDPAGVAIVAMAIVDLGLPHHGNREVGRLAPCHGPLAHFGHLALYHGRLGLGDLDLPAIKADRAVAQNEQDNDNAWPHWKRKIAFI